MKLLIVLTLFAGILMVVYGIYEERMKTLQQQVKVEYRFIPRSYYDEQLFANQFESKFSNLFDEEQDQWSNNNQKLFERDTKTKGNS